MYLIKPGKLYDFMGMRKYFLVLSAILLSASVIAFFVPGPKWGTDFKGGTEVLLEFKQNVDPAKVREAVEGIRGTDGSLQFGSAEVVAVPDKPNHFLIRVQEVSSISDEAKHNIQQKMCFVEGELPAGCTKDMTPNEVKFSPGGDKITFRYDWKDESGKPLPEEQTKVLLEAVRTNLMAAGGVSLIEGPEAVVLASQRDSKVEVHLKAKGTQLMEGLQKAMPEVAPDKPVSIEWVGPKAGAQLRDAAFKSVGIAVFFIMAYIAFRFDLRFAPGAIVALIHDVLISLGAMCLARKEITISTVAAVLTILGYSLTDTVIVYDRIRENLGRHRGMTFSQIVNLSVSEMFGRTIITSSTAAASMLMFLFFGTQVIKDFAFAMLVGIAVGTYSSIYVAAPTTEWVDRVFFSRKQKVAKPPRTRQQRRADAVV